MIKPTASLYCLPRALTLTMLLAAAMTTGCGDTGSAHASSAVETPTVQVRATRIVAGAEAQPLRFAGSVRARDRAVLTFQVGGVIRSRPVEIGQLVEPGAVLATLYNPELEPARAAARARLNELQAQTDQARREQQRGEQLFERGVVSAQELEQQRARLAALEAGMLSARAGLSQTEQLQAESQLKAPFGGRVEAVLAEPGEFVTPGQPVLRLASNEGLEVEVRAPAHLLSGLTVGQPLPVWSSLGGQQVQGRLKELGQGASQAGVLYPLVVSLDTADLRTGDAVEVGLSRPQGSALQVPLAAVMRTAQGLAVFRVDQGRVERVPVVVEAMQGELALVEDSLLRVGDQVVYAGLTRLSEGDVVELLP